MRGAGFDVRVPDVAEFVARTRVVPLAHSATGVAVDVVLGGPGLEEDFLRTARDVDFGGLSVSVIAPEELVVTKILAGRAKDFDDVRGIVAAQAGGFDPERVRSLLRLLETALDRSDLVTLFDEQLRTVLARR